MFAAANQAHFALDIPGISHDFKVLSFDGVEQISQPYQFQLQLVSERPDLDIDRLLQQPAYQAMVQTSPARAVGQAFPGAGTSHC